MKGWLFTEWWATELFQPFVLIWQWSGKLPKVCSSHSSQVMPIVLSMTEIQENYYDQRLEMQTCQNAGQEKHIRLLQGLIMLSFFFYCVFRLLELSCEQLQKNAWITTTYIGLIDLYKIWRTNLVSKVVRKEKNFCIWKQWNSAE